MPGRFSGKLPNFASAGTWSKRVGTDLDELIQRITKAIAILVGVPDTPTQIQAGVSADPGSVTSGTAHPALEDHVHSIETAAPIGLSNSNSEGTGTALMRADAGIKRDVRVYLNQNEVATRNIVEFNGPFSVEDALPVGVALDRTVVAYDAADLSELVELCGASYALEEDAGSSRVDQIGLLPLLENGGTIARDTGRMGYAASFDGSAKWLATASGGIFDVGDTSMTVAIWYYPHADPYNDQFRMVGCSDGGSKGWMLQHTDFTPDSRLFQFAWNGTGVAVGYSYRRITLDSWYLLIGWRDKAAGQIGCAWYGDQVFNDPGPTFNGQSTTAADAVGVACGFPFEVGRVQGKYTVGRIDGVHFFPGVALNRQQRDLLWAGGPGRQLHVPSFVQAARIRARQAQALAVA